MPRLRQFPCRDNRRWLNQNGTRRGIGPRLSFAETGAGFATRAAYSGSQEKESAEANGRRYAEFFSCSSDSRTVSNSFFFSLSTSGKARFSPSSAVMIAEATISCEYHLLSAGTTYQGACLVAVFSIISS